MVFATLLRRCVLAVVLLLAGSPFASAQTVGDCMPGTAVRQFETAGVRAPLYNTGSLFSYAMTFDGEYEVPRGSGNFALNGMGLWIGGKVGDSLRVVHTSQYGVMLRPGPLNEAGLPPEDCTPYDRIYVVTKNDVERYLAGEGGGEDLLEWPVEAGAPVLDGDGVAGNYNLAGGDEPAILGDRMAWWVMNDVYYDRIPPFQTQPINLEVQVSAFAIASNPATLRNTTLYRYRLRYMGAEPFDSVHVAHYVHSYLGDEFDNYVGSDTTLDMGFFYNAEEVDEEYGVPPAVGLLVLQGPVVDGERLGMTSLHHQPRVSGGCNPGADAEDSYNLMRGIWCDGIPITEGGNGYLSSEVVTPLAFPGDPVEEAYWSQENNDGSGTNSGSYFRRMVQGIGPFSMQPGDTQEFTVAVVFAQGDDRLDSIVELREATRYIRNAYDLGLFEPQRVRPPPAEPPPPTTFALGAFPNPFTASASVELTVAEGAGALRLAVYDVLGREVAVVADGVLAPGVHPFAIDGAELPAGVYFVRLETGRQTESLTLIHTD